MQRILRLHEVEERTGIKRTTIYRLIQQREFPAPLKLTKRASGWLEESVNQWIEARTKESQERGVA